ncbi:uncharacterized protein ASPGLDRAFT_1515736 [Aspergillus glaucus CBS 516.65]|uniref:Uncharacterized protein n=1 Tax=Aspergillus glaucus CBS 516.65 TaxID=1160497 RepID=A0A1L9VMW2_ASPGL|nr:hypothetical protein ASPGLDRAFT_1515736 [Aspergillus glaucus CBS 516.65]OJJ85267.1 hypothetical protein ASPGLDRAFT_1515736 [Aspergillus glaucus CBS 516.65]
MSWHFPGWEGQDNGGSAANLEAAGQDCTENCSQGPRSVLAQEYGIELVLCIPWYTMSVTINHICSLLNSVICISTMYSVLVVLNTAIYSCQGLLHTADRHDWRFRALFICPPFPFNNKLTLKHGNNIGYFTRNLKLFIQPSELSPKVKRNNSNRAPIGHRINSHQPQPSGPQTHGRLSLDCSLFLFFPRGRILFTQSLMWNMWRGILVEDSQWEPHRVHLGHPRIELERELELGDVSSLPISQYQ